MHVGVVLNPTSGTAAAAQDVCAVFAQRGATCELIAMDAVERGDDGVQQVVRRCDVLVAAGGDGTIRTAATLLVQGGSAAALGVLPLGTNNDFSRSLHVPADLPASADVIVHGRSVPLDVLRLDDGTICINQANGGFSGAVRAATEDAKQTVPTTVAYGTAALAAFAALPTYALTLVVDGERVTTRALDITIANARFAGGGVPTAPRADYADGKLDIVIIEERSRLSLLTLLPQIRRGAHLDAEGVWYRQATQLAFVSEPAMPFSIDGEVRAQPPRSFTVEPHRLHVRVAAYVAREERSACRTHTQ